jgi:hypothetical protein
MDRTGNRRAAWGYGLVLGGFGVLIALPVFTRPTGDWEQVYFAAARQLRAGDDLLANGTSYVYPPFAALLAVPFTLLPRTAGLVVWAGVNVLALAVLLRGAWKLSGGRGVPATAADHLAFALGGMCAAGFLLDGAAHWQTDLVIGAAVVGGGVLLAGGRGLGAGIAFGVAAAFKCTPLLFAPYLLWKRRPAAAVAVPAVALGLNLLPDLAYPARDGRSHLGLWKDRLLAPMTHPDYDPGMWASAVIYNHSLAGVNLRWLAFDRTELNGATVAVARPVRPSPTALKRLDLALAALLGSVALLALRRRASQVTTGPPLAAELGVVITLMLLLSPMSSKPHFGVLLVPQLALVRVGLANRDRLLLALAVLAGVGGLATGKDLVGRRAYEFLLWNGLIFAMTLVLYGGCCLARWRYAGQTDAVADPVSAPAPTPANTRERVTTTEAPRRAA